MLGVLKLIIEVRGKGLYVRFVPFHFQYREYLLKDIRHYESITYSPLKDLEDGEFVLILRVKKSIT